MKEQFLYVNGAGDSCLKNWTVDELRAGYEKAEETNDDIFYLAIMAEFERRNLQVIDPLSADSTTKEGEMILFLDIDGVLNGHQAHGNGYCGIRKENVEQLNRILASVPDLKIVVSSAWRYIHGGGDMTRRGFEYLLLSHGVDCKGRLAGFTESDEATMEWAKTVQVSGANGEWIRKMQIQRYVDANRIRRYAVLDDLMFPMPQLVRTDPGIGLTEKLADDVIARFLTTPTTNTKEK